MELTVSYVNPRQYVGKYISASREEKLFYALRSMVERGVLNKDHNTKFRVERPFISEMSQADLGMFKRFRFGAEPIKVRHRCRM